jgi:hypothetical protein
MEHRFPLFIREVIAVEVPARTYALISKLINTRSESLLGIQDGEEGIEVLVLNVS